MFCKHWIKTNNFEESWGRTKRFKKLLNWYRIGLKDGTTEQYKLVLQESIDEEKLDKLAEEVYPYDYTTSLHASEESDYINDLRAAFKKGYRAALKL